MIFCNHPPPGLAVDDFFFAPASAHTRPPKIEPGCPPAKKLIYQFHKQTETTNKTLLQCCPRREIDRLCSTQAETGDSCPLADIPDLKAHVSSLLPACTYPKERYAGACNGNVCLEQKELVIQMTREKVIMWHGQRVTYHFYAFLTFLLTDRIKPKLILTHKTRQG